MAGHIQNDLKLARGMGHYADDGFARLQRQTQSLLQEMRAAKTLKDFDKGLGRFLSDFQADEDFSAKTNAFSVVLNLHRLLNPGKVNNMVNYGLSQNLVAFQLFEPKDPHNSQKRIEEK